MARQFILLLSCAWAFAVWGAGDGCGQTLPSGRAGDGTSGVIPGASDLPKLLANPLYYRYRPHHQTQSGVSPAYQQQALLQQQSAYAQQQAAEKAKKREAARERKLAAAKERRVKETEAREQKRLDAAAAAAEANQ